MFIFGTRTDLINRMKGWKDITKRIKADIIVLDMPLLDTTKYRNVTGLENLITDIVLQLLSFC